MDGVYNTEMTAPFDISHHTRYREGIPGYRRIVSLNCQCSC